MSSRLFMALGILLAVAANAAALDIQLPTWQPQPISQEANFTVSVDGGTPPYTVSWDFGDGTTSGPQENLQASHHYAQPGHYGVVVTVVDADGSRRLAFRNRLMHRPLSEHPPASSQPLAVASDGLLWVCNPDQDSVAVIDPHTQQRLAEIPVGAHPLALTAAADGRIWVVCRDDDSIHRLDAATRSPIDSLSLPYGARPTAIIADDQRSSILVVHSGRRLVQRLGYDGQELSRRALAPDPMHVALAGDGRVLIPRFRSPDSGGHITVLATDLTVLDTLTLVDDPGAGGDQPDTEDDGRGIPTQIGRLAVSPDGHQAWYPAIKANVHVGLVRDGTTPTFENTVRTMVAPVDLNPVAEQVTQRIDLNDRDSAAAVAFLPLGNMLAVAVQGSNQLEIIDVYSGDLVGGLLVGAAPQGLAVSADGHHIYVHDFLDRQVSIIDSSEPNSGNGGTVSLVATVTTTDGEALGATVHRGKQIFYHAADRRMSRDGYISCASCHLDGGHDGRTWDFTDRGEGLRNTTTLHGRRGSGHGPVHWTANFDEIQDFEHDIRGPFGGSGFLEDDEFHSNNRDHPLGGVKAGLDADLDALAAYVSSLSTYPRSPHRAANGSLTAAGERGRAEFARLNCQACHSGADYTDSAQLLRHDVGTALSSSGGRLGGPLDGFDTPTLRGLWESAPYLHDGRAADLDAVFAIGPADGVHGLARGLSPERQEDLKAYLMQLDGSDSAVAPGTRRIVIRVSEPGSIEPQLTPAHDQHLQLESPNAGWSYNQLSSQLPYRINFMSAPEALGLNQR